MKEELKYVGMACGVLFATNTMTGTILMRLM